MSEDQNNTVPVEDHYRRSHSAQFNRQAEAPLMPWGDKGVVVESHFTPKEGGAIATYTTAGRSLEAQRWEYDRYGKLVKVSVKKVLLKNPDSSTAWDYLRPDSDLRDSEQYQLVDFVVLERNRDGVFRNLVTSHQIIEDGENGEDRAARYSRLRTDWFAERVAHSHELAEKQNPAPTESQAV